MEVGIVNQTWCFSPLHSENWWILRAQVLPMYLCSFGDASAKFIKLASINIKEFILEINLKP